MPATTMPLRQLTVTEKAVVSMFNAGTDMTAICDQSGMTRAQVLAAVDLAKRLSEAPAAQTSAAGPRPAAEAKAATAPRAQIAPAAPAAAVTRRPEPRKVSVPLETDELLQWAETEGNSRANTLAAAIRARLTELAAIHERDAATAEQRRIVAVLEKQLADAKAQLRQTTAAPVPKPIDSAPIRAWAKANGHHVPPRGRVPQHVVAAYKRLNPETA